MGLPELTDLHTFNASQQQGQQNISAQQAALAMQQTAGINAQQVGQSLRNSIQNNFNPWTQSKYSKEEMTLAIGQRVLPSYGLVIHSVNDYDVVFSNGNIVSPRYVTEIPFIDNLRKTKLYKMAAQ